MGKKTPPPSFRQIPNPSITDGRFRPGKGWVPNKPGHDGTGHDGTGHAGRRVRPRKPGLPPLRPTPPGIYPPVKPGPKPPPMTIMPVPGTPVKPGNPRRKQPLPVMPGRPIIFQPNRRTTRRGA